MLRLLLQLLQLTISLARAVFHRWQLLRSCQVFCQNGRKLPNLRRNPNAFCTARPARMQSVQGTRFAFCFGCCVSSRNPPRRTTLWDTPASASATSRKKKENAVTSTGTCKQDVYPRATDKTSQETPLLPTAQDTKRSSSSRHKSLRKNASSSWRHKNTPTVTALNPLCHDFLDGRHS